MRRPIVIVAALVATALPVCGQDLPSNLAAIELDRSRTCVDVLSRMEALNVELAPLANRAQRLLGIAGAITIEESSVVDSLNATDPLEAAVLEWFRSDGQLAQRYLSEQSQAILDQRTAGRDAILERMRDAIDQVQARADSVVAPTPDLPSQSAACNGMVLLRGTAVQACGNRTSAVCAAARDSTAASPFRFADSPELIWYRKELRPWTAPTALQVTPDGQLGGARTVGATRIGNVIVNVAFNPMIRAREELTPEASEAFDSINSVIGIQSTHPDITFAPALGVQANLPQSIGGESGYMLHFGTVDDPDVLWTAEADTGAPVIGTVALAPRHVQRLLAGEPLTLSAVQDGQNDEIDIVFSIELSSVNQAQPVQALLAYMARQLSADLTRLIPPENP